MGKALLVMELIAFTLLAISIFYSLITMIIDKIQAKREAREFANGLMEIKKAIIKKVEEAEVETENKNVKTPKKQKTTKSYDDMTISELRNVAKSKKIKGYYNLKKDELIETLKETEILPE